MSLQTRIGPSFSAQMFTEKEPEDSPGTYLWGLTAARDMWDLEQKRVWGAQGDRARVSPYKEGWFCRVITGLRWAGPARHGCLSGLTS